MLNGIAGSNFEFGNGEERVPEDRASFMQSDDFGERKAEKIVGDHNSLSQLRSRRWQNS